MRKWLLVMRKGTSRSVINRYVLVISIYYTCGFFLFLYCEIKNGCNFGLFSVKSFVRVVLKSKCVCGKLKLDGPDKLF